MSKIFNFILTTTALTIITILMAGCSDNQSNNNNNNKTDNSSQNNNGKGEWGEELTEDENTTENTTDDNNTPGSTLDNPIKFQTPTRLGDWEITVKKATPNGWPIIKKENIYNDPPSKGSKYFLIRLLAVYKGKETGTPWIDLSTKFYGNKGNTFIDSCGLLPNDMGNVNEMFPGSQAEANMCINVPADQVKGGLLIIEPTFDSEYRRFFALS